MIVGLVYDMTVIANNSNKKTLKYKQIYLKLLASVHPITVIIRH